MVDTWFLWDGTTVVVLYALSMMIYFVLRESRKHKDDKGSEFYLGKIAPEPKLFGSLPAIAGFFMVGLYCVVSLSLYFLSVVMYEYYISKKKVKI